MSLLFEVSGIFSNLELTHSFLSVLYCVTLGFMGMGIHRHRMAGKPIAAGGSFGSNGNAWSTAEKNELKSMPQAQAYPVQQSYPAQSPYGGQGAHEQVPSPASAYSQGPPIGHQPTPEVYGSTRY